jgi:mono/diheme cytochrome c family protein
MLIVSRGDQSAVPALEKMLTHPDTNARIHSLWSLQGLGALKKERILAALKDKQPRVRRAAVQLAEPSFAAGDAETVAALKAMGTDPDPQVATQQFLACAAASDPEQFQSDGRSLPLVDALKNFAAREAEQSKLSKTARKGRLVYESLCITCHGADGMGVKAGDLLMAPPLAKSPWMANNGNVPVLARILLKGQIGPIEGINYAGGLMPALEKSHTDDQIAQVLTYAGERWHGWNRKLTPDDIAPVRKFIESRTAPWTHEELKAVK